jgi:anti-sigma factor RsiW
MTDETRLHLADDQLHAFADGTLSASSRAAVVAHLDSCPTCTALVDGLRGVLAAADSVPRSIEPPRDLWPEIRARIRGEARAPADRGRGWRYYTVLAAAAVMLVAISSMVTREVVLKAAGAPNDVATVESLPSGVVPVSEYDRLDRELTALLETHRRSLRPETIATVERNLAIIDRAIAEIRVALVEDPANRALHDLLRASYGQKAALLRQVSRT